MTSPHWTVQGTNPTLLEWLLDVTTAGDCFWFIGTLLTLEP